MDAWRTAIVSAQDGAIRLRGYDVRDLMRGATFTDTIFLLHRGELPTAAERRLLDAILSSVADHGSGAPSVPPRERDRRFLTASRRRYSIWPFTLRNSSAAHFSSAL